jgi:hypothetical protein
VFHTRFSLSGLFFRVLAGFQGVPPDFWSLSGLLQIPQIYFLDISAKKNRIKISSTRLSSLHHPFRYLPGPFHYLDGGNLKDILP